MGKDLTESTVFSRISIWKNAEISTVGKVNIANVIKVTGRIPSHRIAPANLAAAKALRPCFVVSREGTPPLERLGEFRDHGVVVSCLWRSAVSFCLCKPWPSACSLLHKSSVTTLVQVMLDQSQPSSSEANISAQKVVNHSLSFKRTCTAWSTRPD